jgi:hypothetical protein
MKLPKHVTNGALQGRIMEADLFKAFFVGANKWYQGNEK